MKNVTFSADEVLLEAARARARAERTSLNDAFRTWLAAYARPASSIDRFDAAMSTLRGSVEVGKAMDRAERNER